MVELEIKKKYEKFRLDVAFKSEKKRIGILGASGCGKSLTLKSIAGIERPDVYKRQDAYRAVRIYFCQSV